MSLHPSMDIVADALQGYAEKQTGNNLIKLLRALTIMLLEKQEVIIPIAPMDNVQDGQIMLVTQTTEAGLDYVTAFSSLDAYAQGKSCPTITRPLLNYFNAVMLMDDIDGIIFNPTSPTPFTLQKQMMQGLLAEANNYPLENKISIWQGDITTLDCDAIVNAANKTLLGGGGVDGAIHKAAGHQLLAECQDLGGCETGEAKITFAYDLKAGFVIHTVGPIYEGKDGEAEALAACYRNSLDLAQKHHLHTIAFPAISTGVYKYPIQEAARIALLTTNAWLNEHTDYGMEVILTCFDAQNLAAYQKLVNEANTAQ